MDKTPEGVLYPNDHELEGLRLAFDQYSTGNYSDNQVARLLNGQGYVSKTGKPFSTDTVRDMLQNRTYLGYIKYQKYKQHTNGKRSWEAEVEWFKGKHDAVISEEVFERCQAVRAAKAQHHEYYPKYRVYLLHDIVFCADCVANMPKDVDDDDYGKMRAHSNTSGKHLYYRCRARDFGRTCPQGSAKADPLEQQVVSILKSLKPPADWRDRMIEAMGDLLGDQKLEERLAEIKAIISRMDFRWDQGFITDKDQYLDERVKLQQELEQLTPIPDDDLERAASLLENFSKHWNATAGDREAQRELIQLIVARIWVRGDEVVAMSLRPDYHVTVGLESKKPTEVTVDLDDVIEEDIIVHNWERRALAAHWVGCLGTKHLDLSHRCHGTCSNGTIL